jgi:hypothetical protein
MKPLAQVLLKTLKKKKKRGSTWSASKHFILDGSLLAHSQWHQLEHVPSGLTWRVTDCSGSVRLWILLLPGKSSSSCLTIMLSPAGFQEGHAGSTVRPHLPPSTPPDPRVFSMPSKMHGLTSALFLSMFIHFPSIGKKAKEV